MSPSSAPRQGDLPNHIGIIMDGNGRWAVRRGLPRSSGHIRGTSNVKEVIRTADKMGVKFLTLYCFSTENWNRPPEEIEILMELLKDYLIGEKQELLDNNIRLQALGQISRLPLEVLKILNATIEETSKNTGMILSFCISYGARDEIVQAAKTLAVKHAQGKLDLKNFSEELFARHLFTHSMPEPDLIIRTSGEYRLSNFLLWQSAYSEIYVTETLWPDFQPQDLVLACESFAQRRRRFGRSDEHETTTNLDEKKSDGISPGCLDISTSDLLNH